MSGVCGACEPLTHEPNRPARSKQFHPGEHAYLDQWHELVRTPLNDPDYSLDEDERAAGMLGVILWHFPVSITNRHSQIAASFITWLGTNVGGALIHGIRAGHAKQSPSPLETWWKHNHRRSFVNRGFRSSDYLTSADWSNPQICKDSVELEVFDCLADWLGAEEGRKFVLAAEERELAYRREVEKQPTSLGAGVSQ